MSSGRARFAANLIKPQSPEPCAVCMGLGGHIPGVTVAKFLKTFALVYPLCEQTDSSRFRVAVRVGDIGFKFRLGVIYAAAGHYSGR